MKSEDYLFKTINIGATYEKTRPEYPEELFEGIVEKLPSK